MWSLVKSSSVGVEKFSFLISGFDDELQCDGIPYAHANQPHVRLVYITTGLLWLLPAFIASRADRTRADPSLESDFLRYM